MEDNRGLILTVIGLPASFIFDLVMQVSIISDEQGTQMHHYVRFSRFY